MVNELLIVKLYTNVNLGLHKCRPIVELDIKSRVEKINIYEFRFEISVPELSHFLQYEKKF